MTLDDANRLRTTGVLVILMSPLLGTVLRASESPTWATVLGIGVMLALVALGSSLVFRRGPRSEGWRPSDTLPGQGGRDH